MTTPRPASPWLRELPVAVGVVGGALGLWWMGRAWVLDGSFVGYRWPDYVAEAMLVAARQTNLYDPFRQPLHGALLAGLGEALGRYSDAAVLISSAATLALVLAAALAGRALGGPWAGGLAALTLPWTHTAAWMSRWANSYALLSGLSGLSLGLAVAAARWPGLLFAAGAGLAGGLAWGVDARGLLFAPAAAGLVLLGATAPGLGWRRWLMPPLFALGLAVGPWSVEALGQSEQHAMSAAEKLHHQRGVVHRWVQIAPRAEVISACASMTQDQLLTREYLSTPCAKAVLRHNLEDQLPGQAPFGRFTALALIFALLPGGRGLRGSLEGLLSVLAPAAAIVAFALITPLPERYLAPMGLPLALAVPLALGRLAALAPSRAQTGLAAALTLLAAGFAWISDPASRHKPSPEQLDPQYGRWTRAAAGVTARLEPDEPYLDCSLHYVDLAMLPERRHELPWMNTGTPSMNDDHTKACLAWIQAGVGAVSVDRSLTVEYAPVRGGPKRRVDLGAILEAHGSWSQVWSFGDFELWRGGAP
ncbi:hypothetical protein L6R49_12405 [Myxococcota bacterium]|nr:hypothetical protein [Myxococcota bacterium]